MKHKSIIMIQRPNKSPCNGNTRGPLFPRNFVCNNQSERWWKQFSGTQVFRFWNSCHTRQPLLETPMLPQWWCENIKRKRRGKLSTGVLLLHDNVPAHKSRTSRTAIRKWGFVEINHPPYSPDLAPSDYILIKNLKTFVRGRPFPVDNSVKEAVTGYSYTQDV